MSGHERLEHEEEVQPTIAPAILAFGASFLFAGITMHWLFAAAGGLIVVEALRRWTSDLIEQWSPKT